MENVFNVHQAEEQQQIAPDKEEVKLKIVSVCVREYELFGEYFFRIYIVVLSHTLVMLMIYDINIFFTQAKEQKL